MKRELILFLAVCSFAFAMVPRERRAVNPEEEEERLESVMTTTTTTEIPAKVLLICAPQTPCAWSIYKSPLKYVELIITNTYCVCGEGTVCQVNEDDTSINAFVQRCRPPKDEDEADGDNLASSVPPPA